MDKPVKPKPKKQYSPPILTLYGTVRQLTLHVGIHGKTDRLPRNPTHNKTNF
jgi:hypothetical protein